jgi:hypothetical protein
MMDIDQELQQYIATALWSTNADYLDLPGYLEDHFGPEDIAPEALASMRADLANFLNHANSRALGYWVSVLGDGQIGHDFWLTRNRHGAGFWDRFAHAGAGRAFGVAGQYSITAMVEYPGEESRAVTFTGSVYGGPVLMGESTFVTDPGRFGAFGERWVRRFFA